jgi:ferritin
MFSERLLEELNLQLKYEFYSAHLYLAFAGYAYKVDLPGFANFFIVQAEEEKFHAMRFFNFIQEMDGEIELEGLDKPEVAFANITELFESSLEHEKFVTSRIYKLMDIAMEEREHATISFLKWFIDEQVEEEATFKGIIQKLKRSDGNTTLLYDIDDQLGARVFTPPVV